MSILVAGGAGYIGSHIVDKLIGLNYDVIVIDNLSTGHKSAINSNAKYYEGDNRDASFLKKVFDEENIECVIHTTAYSLVGESMKKPLKYFDNNLIGMIRLLEAMNDHNVKYIVFSSSAATYGIPKHIPISEDDEQLPINPYGETKVMMEHMMKWCDKAYGIKWVALRYFNAAGAKSDGSIGEDHNPETHLIPIILRTALGKQKILKIYGDDYNTFDGTNIRDYVHVMDLADAHIEAMKYLMDGNDSDAFNLGSSHGLSNKQILESARLVTKKKIPAEFSERRLGDPDVLVADSTKARNKLGWSPKYEDVNDIISTAWKWSKDHPNGYNDLNSKDKLRKKYKKYDYEE